MKKLVGADRVVFSCRNRARFDAVEAIFRIAEEIDLAELAVVDDVDADIDLLLHDFGDRAAQSFSERLFVIRLARELLAEELLPDRAADATIRYGSSESDLCWGAFALHQMSRPARPASCHRVTDHVIYDVIGNVVCGGLDQPRSGANRAISPFRYGKNESHFALHRNPLCIEPDARRSRRVGCLAPGRPSGLRRIDPVRRVLVTSERCLLSRLASSCRDAASCRSSNVRKIALSWSLSARYVAWSHRPESLSHRIVDNFGRNRPSSWPMSCQSREPHHRLP